jgi:hypothetical protein
MARWQNSFSGAASRCDKIRPLYLANPDDFYAGAAFFHRPHAGLVRFFL